MPAWKSFRLGKARNYFKLRTDHRQKCNNLSWITTYFTSSKSNTRHHYLKGQIILKYNVISLKHPRCSILSLSWWKWKKPL